MGQDGPLLYQGRFIRVEARSIAEDVHEVVVHPGAVAILVVDELGRVLLVRQVRAGAQGDLWEIPAGTLEAGETPLEAAKRELSEETSLIAENWQFLGAFFPTPGYSSEKIYLFQAGPISGTLEARSEIKEVRFFPVQEILDMARQGQGDGKTLAALALLRSPRVL